MMIKTLFVMALFQAVPLGNKAGPEEISIVVSVCQLSANPSAYNGKGVTTRAEFESDGIERSLLVDEKCPSGAILPYESDGALGVESLDEAIATGNPGTLDKKIVATFTGHFHFSHKPEMCMQMNREICQRSLEITAIRDLIVTMKQKDK
jgi:hypothetical protein